MRCVCRILGESCTLNVRGLDYMNDDPSSVDVLYAKVSCQDKTGSTNNRYGSNQGNHHCESNDVNSMVLTFVSDGCYVALGSTNPSSICLSTSWLLHDLVIIVRCHEIDVRVG